MKVSLILKSDSETSYLKQVDLSRIPIVGEKINVVTDDSIANTYRVIDVLFYENQETDVFIISDGTVTSIFRNASIPHSS